MLPIHLKMVSSERTLQDLPVDQNHWLFLKTNSFISFSLGSASQHAYDGMHDGWPFVGASSPPAERARFFHFANRKIIKVKKEMMPPFINFRLMTGNTSQDCDVMGFVETLATCMSNLVHLIAFASRFLTVAILMIVDFAFLETSGVNAKVESITITRMATFIVKKARRATIRGKTVISEMFLPFLRIFRK